jgi:hypothetical protein
MQKLEATIAALAKRGEQLAWILPDVETAPQ